MKKIKLGTVIKHCLLIFYLAVALMPFFWILISSFKENAEIFTHPFSIPKSINFDNFYAAWTGANIGKFFTNSLLISCSTVILELLVISMATYSLTRLVKVPILMTLLSMGLMIPIHATLIPNFLFAKNAGLMNSPLGVILIYSACNIAFGFFLLSGFMESIPKELDEAAMIDGAGYSTIFLKVLLPICKPGLATVATFAFLNSWNEFLYASVLLTKTERMTITQGINLLKGQYVTDYGLLSAGLLFAIIPVVIMYVLLQEQVVKGMTAGAIKG